MVAGRTLVTGVRLHATRSGGRNEAETLGVPSGFGRAGHQQHLHPEVLQFFGNFAHLRVAFRGSNVANVDGDNTVGVLVDDPAVDLRVLLARVADHHEGKVRVRREQGPYDAELVLPVVLQLCRAPVSQEQRTPRYTVHVEQLLDHVVEVPRAVRDVEDGVALPAAPATLQGPVEGGHTLKRQPRVGVAEQGDPGHPQEVRRARVHHRVIEVAYNAKPRPAWHKYAPRSPHPSLRTGPRDLDLDRIPVRFTF